MPKVAEFHLAFKRALADVSPHVVTLDDTGSTNDDAKELARAGAPHGTIVVANGQSAGRGRLGRAWSAEPGLGLLASWIVRPVLPVDRWTVLPLLAGVAAAEAVRARTKVPAALKWPNDLLVGERKLGGILVEAEPPAFVVVGVGINVNQTGFPDELASIATSIAVEGGLRLDRADLAAAILGGFLRALEDPVSALARYRELCATLGRRVRVERADREPLEGEARDIDPTGALLVDVDGTLETVAAGEVVHLRDSR